MRHALALALVGALLAGCAPTRQVVPVAAAGIAVEPGQSAVASPDGVQLVVRPSAWQGSPSSLPGYVTPFHLTLPVGILHAGARTQGFVYFPRLRPEATRLTFELHHRLGDAPRVLTLPFAVQRAAGRPGPLVAG